MSVFREITFNFKSLVEILLGLKASNLVFAAAAPSGVWLKEGFIIDKQSTKDIKSPAQRIDERIEELGDWRGQTLSKIRNLIREVDPEVVEEWKWRGTPVWSHDGMICTGETYKSAVKMTFAKGASLQDPSHIFNSSLDGNVRRAIDFHEGDEINEEALKELIRAAIALNMSSRKSSHKG